MPGDDEYWIVQANAADRCTLELGETPQPGQARPDADELGSEMPELPSEAFPNPSPNQPGPTPIGPDPSPEMEPRPVVPLPLPSSPDDLPETHPPSAAAHVHRRHNAGEMPQPETDPEPHPHDPLPSAISPHRPEPDHWPWQEPDPDAPWPEPDVTTPSARAIVVRQGPRGRPRVPVEPRSGGVVGWLAEHEAARKQLLAVHMFLMLRALSWMG